VVRRESEQFDQEVSGILGKCFQPNEGFKVFRQLLDSGRVSIGSFQDGLVDYLCQCFWG